MENLRRVTDHLGNRVPEGHTCLALVPTRDGQDFHVDEEGEYWRVFRFLEGTKSYDSIPSVVHAREAAAEFGRFQAMLRDLPDPRLNETIADFHNTPARYAQFHEVRKTDAHGRASNCGREIDKALEYEACAATLVKLHEAGDIPERVTHNDTKINNVMFDRETDKAVCVIDLDTVMPGLAPYDFGDLVRTATCPTAEDEADLSGIAMHMDYFDALVDGYLSATAGFLCEAEADNLALAGKIITIETGLRFLSDHLSGDRYFRVHQPDQNLERCRAQFALAESIDAQLDKMRELTIAAYRRRQ